jgi:CRISPR-associated protein Csb1
VVSEIIGVGVATEDDNRASGQRTCSRIDPLGVRGGVRVVKQAGGEWRIAGAKERGVRPSEINHSNVAPSVVRLGVSVEHVRHCFVLSLPALRRLCFLALPGVPAASDRAARAALSALSIAACLGQDRLGYALRSRCDLVPERDQSVAFELIHGDGSSEILPLDLATACALFRDTAALAASNGLAMRNTDLLLQPQDKLLELVRKSRDLALHGAEDGAG